MQGRRRYPPRPDAVYLFGTCLVDLFRPAAGTATVALLQRAGLTVIFPRGQTCCGQPAFSNGLYDDARAVARAQLALFSKDLPIVVPSGSCAGMMRTHWPDLFAGQPEERQARAVAERVFELSEFLVHVLDLEPEDGGLPVTVAWHSSCHARREMGIDEEPRRLLQSLAGVDLRPLEREAECCGFGGAFSVRMPEVSGAMAADKAAAVTAGGAEVLVSGDCGCLMNIQGVLERQGSPVRACHLAEFLLERLGDG